MAVKIVNKLLSNNSLIIDNEINELKSIMYREMPGLVQMLFVKKQKLGIPILKLGKTGMYQLGLGRFCKIIDATICEDTSALGVDISCNKILTKEILKLHMLPVPKGVYKNQDELIKSYYSLKETYRNIILEEYIKEMTIGFVLLMIEL